STAITLPPPAVSFLPLWAAATWRVAPRSPVAHSPVGRAPLLPRRRVCEVFRPGWRSVRRFAGHRAVATVIHFCLRTGLLVGCAAARHQIAESVPSARLATNWEIRLAAAANSFAAGFLRIAATAARFFADSKIVPAGFVATFGFGRCCSDFE